jgi:hypothetical protein
MQKRKSKAPAGGERYRGNGECATEAQRHRAKRKGADAEIGVPKNGKGAEKI